MRRYIFPFSPSTLFDKSYRSIDLHRSSDQKCRWNDRKRYLCLYMLRIHEATFRVTSIAEPRWLKIMKVMGTRPLHLARRTKARPYPLVAVSHQPLPRVGSHIPCVYAGSRRLVRSPGALSLSLRPTLSILAIVPATSLSFISLFSPHSAPVPHDGRANSPPLFTHRNNRRLNGI